MANKRNMAMAKMHQFSSFLVAMQILIGKALMWFVFGAMICFLVLNLLFHLI